MRLQACIKFDDGMTACNGGSTKAKVKARFAGMDLERFTGASEYNKERIVDAMGLSGRRPSIKTPITGRLVQTSLEYADLGVKPGQTLRILVSEACSPRSQSLFPEIHLTLK